MATAEPRFRPADPRALHTRTTEQRLGSLLIRRRRIEPKAKPYLSGGHPPIHSRPALITRRTSTGIDVRNTASTGLGRSPPRRWGFGLGALCEIRGVEAESLLQVEPGG